MNTNYEHLRFKMIYWYVVVSTSLVILYTAALTFLPVGENSMQFAQTAQGFFFGTLLGSGVAWLVGGSPAAVLKKPTLPTETTMEGVTADKITTTDKEEKKDETIINH